MVAKGDHSQAAVRVEIDVGQRVFKLEQQRLRIIHRRDVQQRVTRGNMRDKNLGDAGEEVRAKPAHVGLIRLARHDVRDDLRPSRRIVIERRMYGMPVPVSVTHTPPRRLLAARSK